MPHTDAVTALPRGTVSPRSTVRRGRRTANGAEAQEASEERRSLATMSRFEASDSPADMLVSQCSGLPGAPTSNGLLRLIVRGDYSAPS